MGIDWLVSILSISSAYYVSENRVKAAMIIGLISQPFWFILIYETKQWGLLPVDIVYTFVYMRGLWRMKKCK